MTVFISVDGSHEGPYTAEQLEELLRAGAIPADAFYWAEGEENWRPINEHPGFAPLPAAFAPTQATPSAASFRRFKVGPLPKLFVGGGVVIGLVVLLGIVGSLLLPSSRPRLAPTSSTGQTQASNARTPGSTAASSPVLPPDQTKGLTQNTPPPPAHTPPVATSPSASGPVVSVGSAKDGALPPSNPSTDVNVPVQVSIKRRTTTTEHDAPGDVFVAYRGGTTRWLTEGETSSQAKFSARNGTVGWVVNEPPTDHPDLSLSYTVRPRHTLVLFRDGRTLVTLQSQLNFIEEWDFTQADTQVALRCRQSHGPGLFQLFDVESGKLLASASENDEPLPSWVPGAVAGSAANPAVSAGPLPAATIPPSPRVVVADFYAWYLEEIRNGRSPWLNGELTKRPEISRSFAVRITNAKEPEPVEDPVFTVQDVPGNAVVMTDKVNALDSTVAVRLTFGEGSRLVNVRLTRADAGRPWQIDDVQPALVGAAVAPVAGGIAVGATPTVIPAPNGGASERLLIGKWQGVRHLTEYRADHTRVMDGVSLNPPRTWHLDGDRLSEGPGKSIYKVIALDQNQLVLEGDGGARYVHQRIQNPAADEAGTKPLDPVSSARATVLDFYDWYLGCDGRGLSPWKNGLIAPRTDVTRTFAARSQSSNKPEGEADPILAGQHVPIRGFVLDAKVEGLVATVLVRLAVRDIPHDVNVRLVRSTFDAPWQIDDVRPTQGGNAGSSTPTRSASTENLAKLLRQAEARLDNDYTSLRYRLDASHQAALKQEEIEWIKRKDALPADSRRIALIEARITELARWGQPVAADTTKTTASLTSAATGLRLKVFEDEGHTCRLLLPEDGWVPVELPPRGARLALEGPGGTRLSVRPLDGVIGDRSLAIMFSRAVKEQFPFDDVAIQPTKPEDRHTFGNRTCRSFSAEVRDHFTRTLEAMPDGPMKQGMLAGAGPAGSRKSTLIWWSVISEGSATWVVEAEYTLSEESPAEIKGKMERSSIPEIREFLRKVGPPHNDYVRYFNYWKGYAFGVLQGSIEDGAFDAEGLTPVIDSDKQAADANVAKGWNIFMDIAAW